MSALISKPGITSASTLSIPKDWDKTWFRNFIQNQLKGADVRNAIGTNGINVTGTIASPYATISFGPGPIVLNTAAGTVALTINGAAGQQALIITGNGAVDSPPLVSVTKTSNYTGGTAGFVTPALAVTTNVTGSGDTDDEWTGLFILNNSSTGIGQDVALYGQGNKIVSGASPTWAGVFEVRETVATNNPTTGTVGVEVDVRSNGTDTNANRVGIDVVLTRLSLTGAATSVTFGVRVGSSSDGSVTIGHGFHLNSGATFTWGLDTSQASCTSGAIRLAQNQVIALDAAGTNQVSYDGTGVLYKVSGVSQVRLNAAGSVQFGGSTLPITLVGTTAATATAGTDGAPPAQVAGYLVGVVSGTTVKIPYYLN